MLKICIVLDYYFVHLLDQNWSIAVLFDIPTVRHKYVLWRMFFVNFVNIFISNHFSTYPTKPGDQQALLNTVDEGSITEKGFPA